MYHTTSYYIILLRINYTNYHTLSNTKIEIRKCRNSAGAVLFVIALVDLILRARTRVFEGFAYSETRRILLPIPTTDHWQPMYLSTGLHQLTNCTEITLLYEG